MKKIIITSILFFGFLSMYAQWYPVNSNTTENIKDIFMLDSLNGYCVGGGDQFGFPQGNGIIMETSDGGENWTTLFSMDSLSVNNVFVVTAGQNQKLIAFATKNGGSFIVWTFIDTQFQNWIVEPIAYKPIEPQVYDNAIYFIDDLSYLYKLENAQIDTLSGNSSKLFCVNSDGITYVNIAYDSIITTNDFGLTWNPLQGFPPNFSNNQSNFAKLTTISDTIIIKATYPGMTIRSFDFGATWLAHLGAPNFYSQIISSNRIYGIDNYNRLQYTQNRGESWDIQDSLVGSIYYSKIYFYNTQIGFAFGENGQILKTTNGGDIVGINEIDASNKSISIYPNPANDFLRLKNPLNIIIEEIKLIDLRGKLLKRFSNSFEKLDVSQIPNGEYFLQIKIKDRLVTEKIIIAR